MNGLAAAQIVAGYENVTVECPACRARNVYNRVTDLGHVEPIDNQHVTCQSPSCRQDFEIIGDTVNPAYEQLLLDSAAFVRDKRYIHAVLSATTAYEAFFAHVLLVELVVRPSRLYATTRGDELVWLSQATGALRKRTQKHTFEPLRREFLRLATCETRPSSLREADEYIAAIPERHTPEVHPENVDRLPDSDLKEQLRRIQGATIAGLRNDIVHKAAFRPALKETALAVTAAYDTIFRLRQHFSLRIMNVPLNNLSDSSP